MNFSEYFIEVIKKWLIRNYIFLKNSRLVHRQNRAMVRLRGQFNPVGGNHPLIYARLVEAVKTSPSQGEGYGFESRVEYHAPMVETVKTPPSQGGSCGFESRWEYHIVAVPKWLKGAHWKCARRGNIRARVQISPVTPIKYCGVVAAVARRSHKPKVGGAIPSPATIADVVQWREHQPSKLGMWVRFPSSAPYLSPYPSG